MKKVKNIIRIGLLLALSLVIIRCVIYKINNTTPLTNCTVYLVEDGAGPHVHVCSNETATYVYDAGGIYQYIDNQRQNLIIETAYVRYMACTSEYLVFNTRDEVCQIDLSTLEVKEITAIANPNEIITIYTYGDNLFVQTQVEREIHVYSCKADETYELSEEERLAVKSTGDTRKVHNLPYSNEQMKNIDRYFGQWNLFAEEMSLYNDELYALVQYSKTRTPAFINPNGECKVQDALFYFDQEEDIWKLVYRTKWKNVQIAGFSIERQCIYLLEDDGLYRADFKGKSREKLADNPGYKYMEFEWLDGRLAVFYWDSEEAKTRFIGFYE